MTIIDPTKFHVSTTTPPIWEKEESFQEIMAEQLRHAPWLMLSIVLHGIAAVIFLMMPNPQKEEAKQIVQIAPQQDVKEIVEEKPPEPEPEPEKVEEPVIQENEVTETEVTEAQDFTDTVSDTKESAFDSNQWNSAVGLGGGAGGKYGGRRGGRGGGKIGKSTAVGI